MRHYQFIINYSILCGWAMGQYFSKLCFLSVFESQLTSAKYNLMGYFIYSSPNSFIISIGRKRKLRFRVANGLAKDHKMLSVEGSWRQVSLRALHCSVYQESYLQVAARKSRKGSFLIWERKTEISRSNLHLASVLADSRDLRELWQKGDLEDSI